MGACSPWTSCSRPAPAASARASSPARLVTRQLPPILALRVVDLPGERRDYYHYVIADGFDADRELVRLQFGDGERRWTSFRRIERAWRAAGHALITIEPREAPSVAPVSGELAAVVALETAGRLNEAAASYRRLVETGPESALLWTNLGNVEAARGRAVEAEAAYRRALAIAPEDRDALNNLAWLLLEEGQRLDEAAALARRAVVADGPDPHLALDPLARVVRRLGKCQAAVASAERALALVPAGAEERPDLEVSLAETREQCRSATSE